MRVRQASEFNEGLYRTFISPWVQAYATPFSAEMLKWLHPMRMSRYLLSEQFNPWMRNVAASAVSIAASRSPLPHEHPMLAQEHKFADAFTALAVTAREMRDAEIGRAQSELQSLMRISYAVFCLKKKKKKKQNKPT